MDEAFAREARSTGGYQVLEFTWERVTREPAVVVALLRKALAEDA